MQPRTLVFASVLMLTFIAGIAGGACAADTKLECELLGVGLEASPGEVSTSPLYLAAQTETHMFDNVSLEYLGRALKGLKAETYLSFVNNNKASVIVDCGDVRPAGRSAVISDETAPNRQSKYSISRAGIDPEGTQALLYVGYYCGPLCGGGNMSLFERKQGKWLYIGQSMIWIS